MSSEIERHRARNSLLSFVGTAGLAQYFLVPLLGVLSAIVLWVRRSLYGLALLATSTVAAALMIYRGYFTSLGT